MQPDWNQHYLEGDTPWDKGEAAPPLLEWLAAHPDEPAGRILVPGCGLGHDVRALASHRPGAEVIGLDISPLAVERARGIPPAGRERYVAGDFFRIGQGGSETSGLAGAHDWIWEHTCFCAIDPAMRADYVRSAHAALVPGGQLLGVFYLDPYDEEHRPGEGPPHGATLEELDELFAGGGLFVREESYVPGKSYPGREGRERVILWRASAP